MKKFMVVLLLVFAVGVGGILAQSETTPDYATVQYNGIEFQYMPEVFGAVLPGGDPGTPYQTDAPYFANTAPHTTFKFTRPNPTFPEIMLTGELRVYKIADLEAYGEPSYMDVVQQLRQLDTTTLADYASASADYQSPHLPFMPVLNATQVIRTHPAVLNVGNVQGIEYYAYYSQAPEPIVEGQVMYTCQGITTDGLYYVSFYIYVETGLLPPKIQEDLDWNTFTASYADYLQTTFTALNQADPVTFTPQPDALRAFIASITIES